MDMAELVLVTGTGSGIGRAVCEFLSDKGFRVYGAGRTVHEAHGYVSVRMDVTNAESVSECVESIVKKEGSIDVLVNNAGFMLCGPVCGMTVAELAYQFDVNLFSAFRVASAVLPGMMARKRGAIVNVGSIGGRIPLPYHAAYASSKAALMSLTDSLAVECGVHGVRVCLVEPGDVNSSLSANRRYTGSCAQDGDATRTIDIMIRNEKKGIEPRAVAKAIWKAVTAARMKRRYVVGPDAKLLNAVNRFLPDGIRRSIIELMYCVRKQA